MIVYRDHPVKIIVDFVKDAAIFLLIIGFFAGLVWCIHWVGTNARSVCIRHQKIVSMDQVTESGAYGAQKEWLYTLDDQSKKRFNTLYYPGESVCAEYGSPNKVEVDIHG